MISVVIVYEKRSTRLWTFGAEDEVRTRDPQLGRLMLYRLSYFRSFKELWYSVGESNPYCKIENLEY